MLDQRSQRAYKVKRTLDIEFSESQKDMLLMQKIQTGAITSLSRAGSPTGIENLEADISNTFAEDQPKKDENIEDSEI